MFNGGIPPKKLERHIGECLARAASFAPALADTPAFAPALA